MFGAYTLPIRSFKKRGMMPVFQTHHLALKEYTFGALKVTRFTLVSVSHAW